MPKISSAAADSRLWTRALISSALNILAEERKTTGIDQLEPGPSVARWMDEISRDQRKHRALSFMTFHLLPSTLVILVPKFSLLPKPDEG